MKKSVSLKLIVFSLLLVTTNFSYSEDPEFKKGSGVDSTVAGVTSDASGNKSSAFGYNSLAAEWYSLAAGYKNIANGNSSSSVGYQNSANGHESSAFGNKNTASSINSSAFGNKNTASGEGSSAFGSTYKVSGNYSGAFGVGAADWNNTTNQYDYSYINEGNNSYMIGNKNKIASGSNDNFILGNKVSIGTGVQNSVVLGNGSASGGSNTVSVGSSSNKRKIVNVADGTADSDAATLGQVKNLIASGGSPDLTNDVNKLKTDMTNVKNDVSGLKTDMTNVKNDVSGLKTDMTNVKNEVSGLKNDMNNVKGRVGTLENDVSDLKAGMSNVKGKITNVEGKVNTLEGKVGNLETNIAGKADVDASNLTDANVAKWRNKLKIADGAVNSATGTGSTGLGVDNTVTGNYSTAVGYKNKVTGNKSGAFGDPNLVTGNGSYAFGNDNTIKGDNNFVFGNNVTIESTIQNSVALGNNSTVSSSNEVSVGSATLQRKITNVADGEVSATSTDAVTGRQLYKAMQNSTNIENLRSEVYEKIDNVKDEVRDVGSLSAALAGLHPMQYDPKAPAQVMAALGQYKNKQSVAVGLSYYFNDRFMMSAGVALSGEKKTKSMANVGFTVKLGKGSGVSYNETPQYVVQNEVKRLTVENQDLKSQVNNQGRENQELKAEVNSLTIKTKEQDAKIKNLEEKLNMLLKNK